MPTATSCAKVLIVIVLNIIKTNIFHQNKANMHTACHEGLPRLTNNVLPYSVCKADNQLNNLKNDLDNGETIKFLQMINILQIILNPASYT